MDLGSQNFEFRSNVWNWKATLEIIKSLDIVSEGKIRQMSSNATGVSVEKEEAKLIGEKIREIILPKLEPNKRMFSDLSITDKPDDGIIYKDADEQWKNYSANYNYLDEFSEFCLKSKGFQVY
jgi:hypothetical protein